MDTARISALISESNILTSAEREYWTQSLPKMNPEQLAKLEQILVKAQQIPWTEHVQKYFSFITKSAKSYVAGATK
ncbi:hypothetical protein COU78_05930 [Candidatus Peregrinibacteria bacterium CG10_big_fil_rev_8_21_14_0_10_49_24]|nr:MAG: hypothetical protein COV83_04635 [Candidatus Peregrinibacteria bacterium CG11_big_fil_rev_8_21_14_0_20_49_14]PIR50560.1 MAG: hypothetical protein COU78_05930 [Candidatus Peregrinibacteria bacterium CG10_big_fil_rev_8_21_14_0_10_49_24]PJA67930.1 MAG: hypothetical protein CO157_02100 [Candidatus Peregrinibacteria bacterium CG_4_9_14_3_um_filter_49_12]